MVREPQEEPFWRAVLEWSGNMKSNCGVLTWGGEGAQTAIGEARLRVVSSRKSHSEG